ncbi:alternative ribosome rescue aminoacyl-tRNA hydrolase ArfB [Cellulomonas endophytica]|uniref:alternative ribosome rescue aminoacyl-tRNA hydrolase ArfB n=1 Tax=Cellulomonas endophytica TaxID=2494735 RepID=UPI0010123ED5|nr:alternative ribosome rescue aminoacyl-tRNA hydrolase ArfB [Cellulomonas endophytica]
MRPLPSSGLAVGASLVVPRSELSLRFSRSSGPGGQGVNTADSRVELLWDVAGSAVLTPTQRDRLLAALGGRLVGGVLTVTASEHREQLRNRAAAERRLVALVLEGLAPPARARRATRPTRGSQERRLTAKRQRSATKRLRGGRPVD